MFFGARYASGVSNRAITTDAEKLTMKFRSWPETAQANDLRADTCYSSCRERIGGQVAQPPSTLQARRPA